MTDSNASSKTTSIPVTLKWNKQTFSLTMELGEAASRFKERVRALTGVPAARQKLLAKKGGWKGTLKDDVTLDASSIDLMKSSSSSSSSSLPPMMLTVTLIGSAEILSGPTQKTTFLEDLSPADLRAAEEAEAQAAMGTAQGMIQALQLPPHRRDDRKQEMYQYNRWVSGLPQRHIEQQLEYYQGRKRSSGDEEGGGSSSSTLQGKVALQMGLELRRALINDLAVLDDGTCVSVLDDGHVQLWKHAAQQEDVVHPGYADGGVDSVVALNQQRQNQNSGNAPAAAFATAGRGSLNLWTADADPILTLPGAMAGTSPASLQCIFGGGSNIGDAMSNDDFNNDDTTICLATRFQITRQSNPSQFRLPPQNDAERQRRAQAEAQERTIQQALAKAARSIQVWFSVGQQHQTGMRGPSLQSQILEPPPGGGLEGSAPITCLATLSLPPTEEINDKASCRLLIAGDTAGGLRLWKVQRTDNSVQFHQQGFYQLASTNTGDDASCSVVCMEALQDGRLAVSTDVSRAQGSHGEPLLGATRIPVHAARAVHILDCSHVSYPMASPMIHVQSTLMGHSSDAVICMCELPDGGLLTGGGKMDATLQLWSRSQTESRNEGQGDVIGEADALQPKASKTLADVGYVFALAVLPDAKRDSSYYAVAAGRYNTVKIII